MWLTAQGSVLVDAAGMYARVQRSIYGLRGPAHSPIFGDGPFVHLNKRECVPKYDTAKFMNESTNNMGNHFYC
jgi:hypothetical protein